MRKQRFSLNVPGLGTWSFYAKDIMEAEEILLSGLECDEDIELTQEQKQAMRADEMLDDWKEREIA